MPSLAPSSHGEFSMSILKLNVMRAPEIASVFGIWGLQLSPRMTICIKSSEFSDVGGELFPQSTSLS